MARIHPRASKRLTAHPLWCLTNRSDGNDLSERKARRRTQDQELMAPASG